MFFAANSPRIFLFVENDIGLFFKNNLKNDLLSAEKHQEIRLYHAKNILLSAETETRTEKATFVVVYDY